MTLMTFYSKNQATTKLWRGQISDDIISEHLLNGALIREPLYHPTLWT
jgi:hypothetical protein